MQQAVGQSGVISVAQTQLAGGRWDAYVSTNTCLRIFAQGSHFGLRGRERKSVSGGQCRVGHQANTVKCCVRLLGLVLHFLCTGVSEDTWSVTVRRAFYKKALNVKEKCNYILANSTDYGIWDQLFGTFL